MRFQRRSVLIVLLALIFVAFFGTLAVTASMFSHGYDWRYRVISNLLSPRDNPRHYWIAAGGVALTGLFMLPFGGHLYRRLKPAAPRMAALAGGALIMGALLLICDCFVVPQHVQATLGIRRLHEFLARSCAGLIAVAMLSSCWCGWKGRGRILPAQLFWIWLVMTILPLAGVLCSEFLLLLTRFDPTVAQPIRRTLRHSVFWHLGFWEWMGAGAVFVFLCAAVFAKPLASAQPVRSEK